MLVREIMNQSPARIAPEANLTEALHAMATQKSRHLVVVEESGLVIGIISVRDIAMHDDPDGNNETRRKQTTVRSLMTGEPITIGSTSTVGAAARLLLRKAVTALPVVDSGMLVGLLSDRDFTRHFANTE